LAVAGVFTGIAQTAILTRQIETVTPVDAIAVLVTPLGVGSVAAARPSADQLTPAVFCSRTGLANLTNLTLVVRTAKELLGALGVGIARVLANAFLTTSSGTAEKILVTMVFVQTRRAFGAVAAVARDALELVAVVGTCTGRLV